MALRTLPEMINLIKEFEGFSATPYKDAGGVWTIGHGHTNGVSKKSPKINKDTAHNILLIDLQKTEKSVNTTLTSVGMDVGMLNDYEYSAFVSFTFNCGQANLKKLVTGGKTTLRTRTQIKLAWVKYINVNGKANAGLKARRQKEVDFFDKEKELQHFARVQYLIKEHAPIYADGYSDTVNITYSYPVFVELLDNTITNGRLNTNRGYIFRGHFHDNFLA